MEKLINKQINLPDRLFFSFIEEKYGINKGIYNTIDLWLYKHGFENLYDRRKMVLHFLQMIQEKQYSKRNKIKFGSGGLAKKLQDFLELRFKDC